MDTPIDLGHPAQTRWPVHELLRERYSPREFEPHIPARDALMSLFEAARWAPSSYNEQPWSFVLATSDQPDDHLRLAECLVDANRAWAEKAPVLVLSVASIRFSRNQQPNAHAWHDVGLAVSQLTLQATALGLALHQMAGFNAAQAVAALGIPDGQAPVAMLAIGYPVPVAPTERSERSRRALEATLYGGRWGEAHALLEG